MSKFAPDIPSLTKLEAMYPLDQEAACNIRAARLAVGATFRGSRFLGVLGPCAMTEDREIIDSEGDHLHELEQEEKGLVLVHRKPPWKLRSNPEDWHGLETTSPETAYRTIAERAGTTANVAIEIGHIPHLRRYGKFLTLGWMGSRNAEDVSLADAMALEDPTLPVGVKNSMDGTIDRALRNVTRISSLRGDNGAPAIPVYRGGENAQNSKDWESNYRQALERTDGRLIVDTAHGGEMAHHPNGEYAKSVVGQIACMEHVISIAEQGEIPAGIMIEASDAAVSPTDPLMPFHIALDGVLELNSIRRTI
jgi:3-deoxy-D-arabino-heptulosonate 7-phosphate (DAHP) synthase